MQRADNSLLDISTTPVIVCGVLAGLGGAAVGMIPTALVSLIRGDGLTTPAKLVAAFLMGIDALDPDNGLAAALLGVVISVVFAGSAGALFTYLRRREARLRMLIAQGVGFGLVLFGLVWATMRLFNPTMNEHTSSVTLGIAFALFGGTLAVELPLRVGSLEDLRAEEPLEQPRAERTSLA